MLTFNADVIEAIVEALQFVHKNNALPNPAPPGVTLANHPSPTVPAIVNIAYGVTAVVGTIQMTRGQFSITGVTLPTGQFSNNFVYNHSGTPNLAPQDFTNALSDNNLGAVNGGQHRSAIITLTAESCRSNMVLNAVKKLASTGKAFLPAVWDGLLTAFQNYNGTATFKGFNIHAGQQPWTALNADDYLAYFEDRKIKDPTQKDTYQQYIGQINAVKTYINS